MGGQHLYSTIVRRSIKAFMTDEQLIESIRAGGAERERSINRLFDYYASWVLGGKKTYRLSLEEAKDAYSDAIISVSLHIQSGQFRGESSIKTYLWRIFQNRCKNKIRDRKRTPDHWLEEMPNLAEEHHSFLRELESREELEEIQGFMHQLGETCRKILWMRDYEGYGMDEIAQEVGFSSGKSVSSKRHKCLSALRSLIARRKKKSTIL